MNNVIMTFQICAAVAVWGLCLVVIFSNLKRAK